MEVTKTKSTLIIKASIRFINAASSVSAVKQLWICKNKVRNLKGSACDLNVEPEMKNEDETTNYSPSY